MVDLVDAGHLSPKTVNNARTYLSVVLEEAVQRGLIARNPCARVRRLPVDPGEIDYLRLSEIDAYLGACADHYRALAEFLIGSGARVSEGVNVRWDDLPHVELARRLDAPLVTIDRRLVRAATGRAGIPDSAENLLSG